MQLKIENIGKVKKAEIDIIGITSIIGFNSTGKSTISKSLAAIGNAFDDFEQQVKGMILFECSQEIDKWEEKNRNLLRQIKRKGKSFYEVYKKYDSIFSRFQSFSSEYMQTILDYSSLEDFISIMKKKYQLYEWEEILRSTLPDKETYNINIPLTDLFKKFEEIKFDNIDRYEKTVVTRAFYNYFKRQIAFLYDKKQGIIKLVDDKLNENIIIFHENILHEFGQGISDRIPVIYLQPMNILDTLDRSLNGYRTLSYGKGELMARLQHDFYSDTTTEDYETTEKLALIINEVLGSEKNIGELTRDEWSVAYKELNVISNEKANIEMCNVASGIKNIAIIKRLALNGELKRNSILIIDEPEVNLHPEWQLKFAELLVRFYCEVGIKILINTHSPYFLRAIEYYSDEKMILNKCKFYYMKNNENMQSESIDKTNSLDDIYDDMATTLDKLVDDEE